MLDLMIRLVEDIDDKWKRVGIDAPSGRLTCTDRRDVFLYHVPGFTYASGPHDRAYGCAEKTLIRITGTKPGGVFVGEILATWDAKLVTATTETIIQSAERNTS